MDAGFAALRARRERLRASLQENDADLDSILVGIYTDPAHFLYELVQNAEDEGASFVEFDLQRDALVVRHNGEPFTLDDVRDITKIGASGKSTELTKLGRFGVGFKSVFAVTSSPLVRSGPFCFRIEDLVVPVPETPDTPEDGTTAITLPFDHEKRTSEAAYSLTLNRLREFGADALLFLRNVKEIRWRSPEGSGRYERDEQRVEGEAHTHRVEIASAYDEGEQAAEEEDRASFLRISRPVRVGKGHRSVAVAYTLERDDAGEERVVPDPNTPLYVFFPTEKDTHLSFRVQGPFRTTPNRENVPLDDPDNQRLLREAATLVGHSVLVIRRLGLLRVETFDVWPLTLSGGEGELFEAVREEMLRCMRSERVLPTATGSYASAPDSALAGSPELPSLLNKRDLRALYERGAWLHPSISQLRTRALWLALKGALGVPEIQFDGLVRRLDESFFEQKRDRWFVRFYGALRTQRALWDKRGWQVGPLRNKPFIRTEDGRHVAPFNARDRPLVYLPARGTSGFSVVRRAIARDADARAFLDALGLKEPDTVADVRSNIIPKYRSGGTLPDTYARDFETIKAAFDGASDEEKRRLVEDLRGVKVIAATGPDGVRLRRPQEVYFPTSDLRTYFAPLPTTPFVAPPLTEASDVNELLERLGVSRSPRRVPHATQLAEEEKAKMRGGKSASEEWIEDFDLDGLDAFLAQPITPERSVLLWSLLLRSHRAVNVYSESFYRGTYYFIPRSRQDSHPIDAHFLETLRAHPWLFDVDGNAVLPGGITARQLADGYPLEDTGSRLLIEKLGFLPSAIDNLSPELRTRVELAMSIPLEDLVALSRKRKGETQDEEEDDTVGDGVDPESVEVTVTEFEGEPDERTPGKKRGSTGGDTSPPEGPKREPGGGGKRGKPDAKVGRWGEAHVASHLRKECDRTGRELQWLNEEGERGEGCDFIVLEGGEPVEYVEVKATQESGTVVVHLSPVQWASARTLYDKGEGEKYVLYVVRGAGSSGATIQIIRDPVRAWREGRLNATPVDLVIPETGQ